MTYNAMISRNDADTLIPTEVAQDFFKGAQEESVVLRMARRLPNMSRSQYQLPVLSALASAGFVEPSTSSAPGAKPTTDLAWEGKLIQAHEIAAIVPIPEAVLEDAAYDIWGEVKAEIVRAIGAAWDAAVFFGTNAPSGAPTALVTAAIAAGNNVALGTGTDVYADLLGDGGVFSKVEDDGYLVNGVVSAVGMKAKLRSLRDTAGQPVFVQSVQEQTRYALDGAPVVFPLNGCWDADTALMLAGDWTQLVYAIRQDITYKVLTEAVLQDAAGNIVYNLAQQDMVALRVVMRGGWQIPNPTNSINGTAGTRYPFAVLQPSGS